MLQSVSISPLVGCSDPELRAIGGYQSPFIREIKRSDLKANQSRTSAMAK